MSASVSDAVSAGTTAPDNPALEAELRELAGQYPEPDWKEYARDGEWFSNQTVAGTVSNLYGKVVAVFRGEVVAVGDHELVMRARLSRQYQQHPGRFYVTYYGDPSEPA